MTGKQFERDFIAELQRLIKNAMERMNKYEGTIHAERIHGEVQGLESALIAFINSITLYERKK